eukprot:Skav201210  [mRNA]  locus=scaffold651:124252:125484:+ [translate_table: standard]
MDLFATYGPCIERVCVDWLALQLGYPHSQQVSLRLQFIVQDWAEDLPLWNLRTRIAGLETALTAPLAVRERPPEVAVRPRPRHRDGFPSAFSQLHLWEEAQRGRAILAWPALPRSVEPDFKVYVHLYSGRRRFGDVHQWLEERVGCARGSTVILSLDTAVDPKLNIWCPTLWGFLCEVAKQGRLAALLLGPPCETWSAARHRVLQDQWGNLLRGPRPLRGRLRPWGLPHCGLSELRQLDVGTTLLLRGVHLAIITALHGGVVLGEHPREAEQDDISSIWSTALIQSLLGEPTPFFLTHLEQWQFGSRGVKPTTILTANTDLQFWLDQMKCTWMPRPRYALIGRASSGEFRTASAKEYPLRLNQAFAAAMCSGTERACKDSSQSTLLTQAREFEAMCQSFRSSWCPDYQPV